MSGEPVSQAEFTRALEFLRDDIKSGFAGVRIDVSGVHARLDTLNGQTRRHGEDIAVLKSQIAEAPVAVRPSKKALAGYGTAIGSGAVVVFEIAKAAWAALKS